MRASAASDAVFLRRRDLFSQIGACSFSPWGDNDGKGEYLGPLSEQQKYKDLSQPSCAAARGCFGLGTARIPGSRSAMSDQHLGVSVFLNQKTSQSRSPCLDCALLTSCRGYVSEDASRCGSDTHLLFAANAPDWLPPSLKGLGQIQRQVCVCLIRLLTVPHICSVP